MHSNCERIAALMSDYVDESLEPRERAQVAAHIEMCGGCRREAERTKRLVARLGSLSVERAPCDLWPSVARRIAERRTRRRMQDWFRAAGWRMVAVPAAVAAAAVIILSLYLSRTPAPVNPPRGVAQASAEYSAYMQAYSQFRSAQPLSDRASLAAAAHLQRRETILH